MNERIYYELEKTMKNMKDLVCLIPTWLTATHALNAYRSFRKYYPDILVYFMDDISTKDDTYKWKQTYVRGWDSFDPDSSKLIGLHNSCYIAKPHTGFETEGHGQAVTYAMQFIHAKWVLHLSSDVRITQKGLLEFMLKNTNEKTAGVGEGWDRGFGYANLGKWLCLYRGDLYHKYNLDFHADRNRCIDAGAFYFQALVDKGYKLKDISLGGYFVHLGSKRIPEWDKYYIFKDV